MPSSTSPNFEQLFNEENALLFQADKKEKGEAPKIEPPGAAGEPWVSYISTDRVGLAFSGGGIRSATFNLGVLKALRELGVLKYVDYLSTVSGGGYIGAWWTAWRARWGSATKDFPVAHGADGADQITDDEKQNREPEEVRHLREFSNFLSPRIGFFQSEMWNAVVAVLSAMLPAIVVASAVMALAFLIWLGFNRLILIDSLQLGPLAPSSADRSALGISSVSWISIAVALLRRGIEPLVLSILTLAIYFVFENAWRKAGKAEELVSKQSRVVVYRIIPISILVLIWLAWAFVLGASWMNSRPQGEVVSTWRWATGISPEANAACSIIPAFSPHLFDVPIIWAAIALVLLVPRLIVMRILREKAGSLVNMVDRALSRLLGGALIFAAVGAIWLIGCWLNCSHWGAKWPAGGAMLSGGVFALLRNWVGRLGPAKKGGVTDVIKPLIPQILAYLAIVLWASCIAALLAFCMAKDLDSGFWLFIIAVGIVLFAIVSFDPAQVSMHSFYRNRLTRAYLGASNIDAKQSAINNRQTDVRPKDDIQLRDLSPAGAERPIHLVCCAANDVGGDHLESLSRGSRSAVLSRFGFAIGDHCHTWQKEKDAGHPSLGLGSAITASAAAFNSNMGSLSMRLGAGVTFLCTALNLRLGLWLPHPLTNKDGAPPLAGWLFFEEMFGVTKSGLRARTVKPTPVAPYVHLSDGGHFENLALYELVRRHCRYIIVSDCGADPQVAFDDFGNAVRRIREDFGVEIEIDLSPLRPNAARLSKQHVAVGTITYDPRGDRKDTAILLYLKPTLTGDEPCDITQYRTRNGDFPHESTGDQFYDEAQWESYRRLGEHAAHSALRFVEHEKRGNLSADTIFNGARWEWYQSLERREEKILELTGRLAALEQQLRQEAPAWFVNEMYPELEFLGVKNATDPPTTPAQATPEEIGKTLHFLTQMIQLMEDVWFGVSLDTHWTDPNNVGWINTFQRWAYTPSFRLWWPILKPMYGRKFRRFMEERLSLSDDDYPVTLAQVEKHEGGELPKGVAQLYWKRTHAAKQIAEQLSRGTIYILQLHLTQQREEGDDLPQPIQAGIAFLELKGTTARWAVDDFFIPPSFWGAGLGERFLNELLVKLKDAGCKRCEVTTEPLQEKDEAAATPKNDEMSLDWSKRTDLASRQQLNDLLAFYQRAEFNFDQKSNTLIRIL